MIKKITLLYFLNFFIIQVSVASVLFEEKSKIEITTVIAINKPAHSLKKEVKKTAIYEYTPLNNFYNTSKKNTEITYPISDSVITQRDAAAGSFEVIEEHESWVDSFSNEDIKELPVGVKHFREGIEYAIGITQATINKDYTELTVYARVKIPQTDSDGYPIELFFGADNIKLSHQGGLVGDTNLVLLGDLNIPFNAGKWMLSLKGGFDYTTGETENLTYVTINCNGVKELGLEGVVEFSRELILPLTENGEADLREQVSIQITTENGTQTLPVPNRVKGSFNVVASDWNDILVGIDLEPFMLSKKRNNEDYNGNFQFNVNKAILDFSDLRNDPALLFPDYYRDNGLLLPNDRAWRGVYVDTVEVKLPKEFKTSETENQGQERVSFSAHHLIVDNYGVSGTFYGDNIFSLDEGITNDSKAWAYSLDHIDVTIAANNFIEGNMEGRILLPVSNNAESTNSSPERIGLRYSGLISPEEYVLNVSNDSIIDMNLWKAKGQLLPNSSIELALRDNQFRPKATLHGRLAISADQVDSLENEGNDIETTETDTQGNGHKKFVEFKGIVFENLVLQTESPIFQVDYMGYEDEVSLAGFPISISNIGITASETNANLHFDLAINLMGENNGFAGETSLGIIGKFEEDNYRQKWELDKIVLDSIAVDADFGGFAIWGSLDLMKDDPQYGDGFAATLGARFEALQTEVEVNAIFGKTDFRYWMVDAMVDLPPGAGSGIINLSGFAGGASYKMTRQDYGASINGDAFTYTPNQDYGLGLKAMVLLNLVDDSVLKGGAGFEVLFNNNGGINQLGLYGQASMLGVTIPGLDNIASTLNQFNEDAAAKAKFLGYDEEAVNDSFVGRNLLDKAENEMIQVPHGDLTISAKLGVVFDFKNEVLHGELETFVNTPGGFVEGRGANGRSGSAVLHLSKDEWYLYMGTPSDPQGYRIGVGPASLESGGYFMVGSVLPDAPAPPPEVADILRVKNEELDYMRDENALASGAGFAFGQDFSIDTGDLRFLVFYANFQAGAGFDIMLRNYEKAECSNTGDQVGLNGWYANGQAYAYLQGELGINVKLFFIEKKIPLIQGAAAVLLQAKAPNPIWMRGYVGGEFNILGGLVSGEFRFKVTLGEECVFEDGSPLGGLKIITDVTPSDGVSDIDVFAIPQATFSMKVGEPLIIPEDDGDKTYRIDLEEYVIIHNGQEIPSAIEWSNYKDRANLVSSDILPPEEELTVRATVSFKEKINGIFRPILVDGQPATETEERTFTTGGAPDHIPLHNITYAYPVVEQKYFLEDEYNQGYVKLKRGQDYLFDDAAWESFLKYRGTDNDESSDTDFNYNTSDNKLTYTIPNVDQEDQYTMLIASRPKEGNTSGSNTESISENVDVGDTSGDNIINIETTQAESLSKDGEIERLTYAFGTSKYKTFERKINTIDNDDYDWDIFSSDVIYLTNRIDDHEPFDLNELIGSDYTDNKPLVHIEATLNDNYFTIDLNPPLYGQYPLGGTYNFTNRDGSLLGTPAPKYALPIISTYLSNLEYEVNESTLRTTFPFRYNLGLAYKEDWVDLRSQIINDQTDGLIPSGNPVLNFLDESYLFMRYGFYNTNISYKLPGDLNGTSTTYKFKNPNNFRN